MLQSSVTVCLLRTGAVTMTLSQETQQHILQAPEDEGPPGFPSLRGLHRLQPTEAATGRSLEKAAEGSTYGRSLLYSIPPSLAPTHSQILKPWPKDLVLFTAGEKQPLLSYTQQ